MVKREYYEEKLIIYGLGQMFQSYYDENSKRYLSEKYELVGLIDKKSDFLSNIDPEINFYSFIPKDITFDNICITSEKYYDEIKKEVIEEGTPEGVILPKFFGETYILNCIFQLIDLMELELK